MVESYKELSNIGKGHSKNSRSQVSPLLLDPIYAFRGGSLSHEKEVLSFQLFSYKFSIAKKVSLFFKKTRTNS